jgi:hypothetical protein
VRLPPRPAVAIGLVAVLAVIAFVGISIASSNSKPSARGPGSPTRSAHPTASAATTHGRPSSATQHQTERNTHKPKQLTAKQRRRIALEAVRALAEHEEHGAISVAAVNTATGAHFAAGARRGMWTASAYKLFVLETLLWQHGGPLTGDENDLAVPMIEQSDNAAAWDLYQDAGGRAALVEAARRFDMTHTVPGDIDPTLTSTSAMDYLHLLHNLISSHGPLSARSKAYALSLMRDVESDQRWGVGVVADKDSVFYNKNGWLSIDDDNPPGETDNGLWAVTSVGIVRIHGQRVLMAVFTRHQPDFATGVRLVQQLAKAIAPAVAVAR